MSSYSRDLPDSPSANVSLWMSDRFVAVLAGFRSHALLYAVVLTALAVARSEAWWLGARAAHNLAALADGVTLILAAVLATAWLFLQLLQLWWNGYEGSPSRALLYRLSEDILSPARLSNGLHATLLLSIFGVAFGTVKDNIPLAMPFSWDSTLMQIDRMLHFGLLPHEWFATLFEAPVLIFLLNLAYNFWFLVLTGFLVWQGFRGENPRLRQRYLLAMLLCWALGTMVLGTLLSSAGPCFFGWIVPGPNPYAPLIASLERVEAHYPVWALTTQRSLWQSYVNGQGEISGISAMPSMHVATSVLFLLCARAAGIRWLAWCCAAFAVVIFAGSVALAWHYAVDGYAGALIALGCWALAGRLTLSSRPS